LLQLILLDTANSTISLKLLALAYYRRTVRVNFECDKGLIGFF